MAPNVFHIGVEENVSVTLFDAAKPMTVKLYLQDYPHRRKTFSAVRAVLPPQPDEYIRCRHLPGRRPPRPHIITHQLASKIGRRRARGYK